MFVCDKNKENLAKYQLLYFEFLSSNIAQKENVHTIC